MNSLDHQGRSALEALVGKARRLLEKDLAEILDGRFGISTTGHIADKDLLRLAAGELSIRRELEQVVKHLEVEGRTKGGREGDAVRQLIREAAFTHLNRLIAIRVAETIGILPESLANGRRSRGFRDVLEVAPLLAADATGGYWAYLRLCGDELAADAPVLFDPRNPLLGLAPSTQALDELTDLFADPGNQGLWAAPDTLGWAYQFFNTGEERRDLREGRPAPRDSRELAIRNQFFTPRYVIDFLVQNSLGRRLVEADHGDGLLERLPLLIDPPAARGRPLALEEVRALDPACGSGHFLLGCYDLLEAAWKEQGVPEDKAAPQILPCLWGIDIDPRCAQVAAAALMLRARRVAPDEALPQPNIITARTLPEDPAAWQRALDHLPTARHQLLGSVREVLEQAPALGSLLRVEEMLEQEIRVHVPYAAATKDTLFGEQNEQRAGAQGAFDRALNDILMAVEQVAHEADSSAVERLLAAEAGDAIRFAGAMRQRYDVVLMNPPFGEPVPETKPYIKSAYPWIPTKDCNLLAAFVGRGIELCREDGYVGAITSRAGLFLSTFERWRKEILLGHKLVVLADLGHRVMEQALVEAAAYVVGADSATGSDTATFVRLLRDTNRATALAETAADTRAQRENPRLHRVALSEFGALPGEPLAYWMAPSIRRLFAELPLLESNAAEVRQGLATGDDFRFVRAFWEVDPARIARSREETLKGRRWAPFAKGGEYSPYWADIHLVVDYGHDGERLRSSTQSRVQNTQFYFMAGLTWSRRTASGFSPRILPEGCVFADKGPALVHREDTDPTLLLAWLNSRIAIACLGSMVAAGEETTSGAAAKSYEVGLVQKLPWPARFDRNISALISTGIEAIARRRRHEDVYNETTRYFTELQITQGIRSSIIQRALDNAATSADAAISSIGEAHDLEQNFIESLHFDPSAINYLNDEVGPHPDDYSFSNEVDEKTFARLFTLPIDKLIDEVVEEHGGSRSIVNAVYVADRRLEVLAHAFKIHPKALEETRQRLGLLPPEEPRKSAEDLISYLVGIAFGRWDVQIGRDSSLAPPQPDLFDPLPLCPPGMLVDDNGLPAQGIPDDYPLSLPPERLLLDEPGHEWDIEQAVRRAAAVLFDDPEAVLAEVEDILEVRSLRDYLRKQFFKEHLGRYSKSRRKAPIYWHLTVKSRGWGVWVYAPTLSRETLFAISEHAARRQAASRERITSFQVERKAEEEGPGTRDVEHRLAAEENLLDELNRFAEEARRIAETGWEPDMDDGIILCAAPFAELFPGWKDLVGERAKINSGAYPWAGVSRWKGQL